MLRSYRCIVIAAFGWLILGGQSPRAERVASPTPAPKEQAQKSAQGRQSTPAPLAVTVVESPEQAVSAARAQSESRAHDARDLEAQVRAADAAEKQILPSWLAAFLSFIGTCLIIWTLLETQKANKIARDAAKADRAWLCPAGVNLVVIKNSTVNDKRHKTDGTIIGEVSITDSIGMQIIWKNMGRTPAVRLNLSSDWRVHPASEKPENFDAPDPAAHESSGILGPDQTAIGPMPYLTDAEAALFRQRRVAVTVKAMASYMDIHSGITEKPKETVVEYTFKHRGGWIGEGQNRHENIEIGMAGEKSRAT